MEPNTAGVFSMTLPWYIVVPMILFYLVAFAHVIRTIWVRHHHHKNYKPKVYRRVCFKDYDAILARDVEELRADLGVKESLTAFNQFGMDFYRSVEKAFGRNEEFKATVSEYPEESERYEELVAKELGWIHLLTDAAVEIGKRCTDAILRYEGLDETYNLDIDLMRQYIVTANSLQAQYRKLRQSQYIPKTIISDIEMVYRIFFDYFELVNVNVEIL